MSLVGWIRRRRAVQWLTSCSDTKLTVYFCIELEWNYQPLIVKEILGAFHLGKKPEISVGAKVEFPFGKKLFHLVLNPGTSRCPTVDLELVQTTRNVNGTRHSVRKFQPGKRAHLFRFSTFSGNFPVGRADETCSIYRRTRNSGNFDYMESALYLVLELRAAICMVSGVHGAVF